MKTIILPLMLASFCAIADDFSRVSECNELIRARTEGVATISSQTVDQYKVYGLVEIWDGWQWHRYHYGCRDGILIIHDNQMTQVASAERIMK